MRLLFLPDKYIHILIKSPIKRRIFLSVGALVFATLPLAGIFTYSSLSSPANSHEQSSVLGLASATENPRFVFNVNVPSFFNEQAEFLKNAVVKGSLTVNGEAIFSQGIDTKGEDIDLGSGLLTASNVVYSVTGGNGITVTNGQQPVITNTGVLSVAGKTGNIVLETGSGLGLDGLKYTNTDPGSAQSIFKKIAVPGQNEITASSNNDTLTFVAGSGVSISTDATGKSLTISSTEQGLSNWTVGSDFVSTTGNVGIGTTDPQAALDVNGQTILRGLTTITSGGLVLDSGQIDINGGGIVNAGAITGATGLTSSGTITFSGLSEGIVRAGVGGVLSSSAFNLAGGANEITGILAINNGGTGLTSYLRGQLLYSDADNSLAKLSIGSEGQTLVVGPNGLPMWGQGVGGAGLCVTCVVLSPGSTQTITATNSAATGLSVRQAAGGTVDVFTVTNNAGTTKYLQIDSSGNLALSGTTTFGTSSRDQLILTPALAGTNSFSGTITSDDLTAARIYTLPDASGTFCLTTGNCNGVGGNFGGTGTANYVAKFTNGTTVGDSSIYDNGNVGIGTSNPLAKLYVAGTTNFTGNSIIGGTFDASGAAQLASTLRVSGATSLLSTLNVTGAASLSATLNVTGNSFMGGTLGVAGTSVFTGNVGIGTTNTTSYNTNINGTLALGAVTDTSSQGELLRLRVGSSGGSTGYMTFQRANTVNSSYALGYYSTGQFGFKQLGDSQPFFNIASSGTADSLKTISFGSGNGQSNVSTTFYNSSFNVDTIGIRLANNSTGATSNTSLAFISVDSVGTETAYAKITGLKGGSLSSAIGVGGLGFYYTSGLGNYQEGFRLNASGNVGIGTTAPIGLLNVEGAPVGKALAIFNQTGNQNIFVASSSGVGKFAVVNSGDVRQSFGNYFTWSSSTDLNSGAAADVGIGRNAGGTLEINSGSQGVYRDLMLRSLFTSGNVGIGTSSPTGTLNILGNSENQLVLSKTSNGTRNWLIGIGVGTQYSEGSLVFGYGATATSTNAVMRIAPQDFSGTKLLIDPGGNLGIGTTLASNFKLTVAGSIGPSAGSTYDLGSASLPWNNLYVNNIIGASTGTSGYWQRALGAISPTNSTDDLLLGGTATASALVRIGGTTGAHTYFNTGGNVGVGSTSPAAKLDVSGTFAVNSAMNSGWSTGSYAVAQVGRGLALWSTIGSSQDSYLSNNTYFTGGAYKAMYTGAANKINLGSNGNIVFQTAPSVSGDATQNFTDVLMITNGGNVGIGTTTASSRLDIQSSAVNTDVQRWMAFDGSRLARLTETSGGAGWFEVDNSSGVAQAMLRGDGGSNYFLGGNMGIGTSTPGSMLDVVSTATATNGFNVTANSLTSGYAAYLSSSSTAFTTGGLLGLDWSPGSATTATGDLLSLNIGANGSIGNIFNIKDNGSSVFSVSQTGVTANLPVNFTSPGDVSIAYDLGFTNPFASYITSNAPLYLRAGKVYNSSDLTLATYNKGNVIVDSEAFVARNASVSGQLVLGTTVAPANIGNLYLTNSQTYGKALAIFNQTESADIFTASASGATRFVITNNGNVGIGTSAPTVALQVGTGLNDGSGKIRLNDSSDSQQLIFANGGGDRFNIKQNGTILSFNSLGTGVAGVGQSFAFNGGTPDTGHLSSLFKITGAYNNAGQTIDGLLLNITNTSSATTSSLMNLQTSGVSKFFVGINGNIGIGTTNTANPITVGSDNTNGNGAYVSAGGSWTNGSSREFKDNIDTVNTDDILSKINQLNISEWNYKNEGSTVKHIGPIAEDFYSIFGLGNDGKHISTIDPAGVALAGIKALSKQVQELKSQIQTASISANFAPSVESLGISDTDATISGTLSVLGRTTVNDLGVTGKIVSGLTSIDGANGSINVLGDLKLQNNGYGNIDLFAGKVKIDNKGNILTEGTITAKAVKTESVQVLGSSTGEADTIGKAVLKSGNTTVVISTEAVKNTSKIFVTPRSKTGNRQLIVTQVTNGSSFKVEVENTATTDISFDWWVIN